MLNGRPAHRVDARQVVRLLAVVRVVVGVVAFVAPRRSARLVIGGGVLDGGVLDGGVSGSGIALLTRSFGARDVALGLGTLRALDDDCDPQAWTKVSAGCDVADGVAAIAALRGIGAARALPAAASAAIAAASGRWASSRLG